MSMFDNYPQSQDYIPDNRPKCHKPFKLDIMAGETATHTFEILFLGSAFLYVNISKITKEIPFNIVESCSDVEVIYKLGLTDIITKSVNLSGEDVLETKCNHSIITCRLSEEETKLFANTLLDAKVQLKFHMIDKSIAYSEIYKITLVDSLDVANEL